MDVQPYLAEFVRKAFLPSPRLSLKIASLEGKSAFSLPLETGGTLGFELGADISRAVDIDDYYLFRGNWERISHTFADILYKHLAVELPPDYLKSKYSISSGWELITRVFFGSAAYEQLVRASEGVARDLINIFNRAFFIAQRNDVTRIDERAVMDASTQWFRQDQENKIDSELRLLYPGLERGTL